MEGAAEGELHWWTEHAGDDSYLGERGEGWEAGVEFGLGHLALLGWGKQLGVAAKHCHYDASKALQGVLGKGVGVHLQVQ